MVAVAAIMAAAVAVTRTVRADRGYSPSATFANSVQLTGERP